MKTLTKSLGFLLIMLLAVSCAKDEGFLPVEDELSDVVALKKAKVQDVENLTLSGSTHFPSYAVKEHKVIAPWDENTLSCEAILTVHGKQLTLVTNEYYMGVVHVRSVNFSGQISPSGIVKFSWPDEWWEIDGDKTIDMLADQLLAHTGCLIYGPGKGQGEFRLDYKGTFDGENFYAEAHFMGKQEDFGNGMAPWYAPYDEVLNPLGLENLVEGPIQFTFSIELSLPD